MRNLILILMFLIPFISFNQTSEWEFAKDKQLHTVAGVAMGSSLTQLMLSSNMYDDWETIVAPQLPVFFIGLSKEFLDATLLDGTPSIQDAVYNNIGAFIGSVLTYTVNECIKDIHNNKKTKFKL